MIALPGPAFIVIPAGLGILALEFAWARRWLRIAREKSEQARELLRTREPEDTES
jgi:tellurite resistance protein TerC